MSIRISAVISTYNRSELLKGAIKSLIDQTLPKEQYEILVVDNNSTDNTKGVVASFNQIKNLKYLFESRMGISHARNCALYNARGKYIAFIDDDARAEKHFLERILHAFETVNPKPTSVGGQILPFYLGPKPMWFKDEYEIRTKGPTARFLENDGSERFDLFGSNYSLLVNVIRENGGFDVSYGMKEKRMRLGDETEFFKRLHENMGKECCLYYDPNITVYHLADNKNFLWAWHFKRNYASGRALLRMEGKPKMSFVALGKSKAGAMLSILKSVINALRAFSGYEYRQQWLIEKVAPIGNRFASLFYWQW